MRTAIYVKQPTTVVFEPRTQEVPTALIVPFNPSTKGHPATGSVALARGIYLIHSEQPIAVSGPDIEVEISINDKDEWPDPPAPLIALEPGASAETIKSFFAIAKDLEL
jgi:hypothetical protein